MSYSARNCLPLNFWESHGLCAKFKAKRGKYELGYEFVLPGEVGATFALSTVPTLDHCALIIFFGAMETRNEYFDTLEIGVRNRVRKREIIPVRAGAQLCAIAKQINVINSG